MRLPEKGVRALLFLALVVWMALAGGLFLETIVISLGAETTTDSGTPISETRTGGVFQGYRVLVSLAALFFGYHCLSRREWARKGAVALLVLDLTLWLGASIFSFLSDGRFGLGFSRMILQVFVVLFEVGLLRLLLDGQTQRDFQYRKSGVHSPEYERTC